MKHYGDITKLSGYDLPPVDCITGGSPCQDLSLAGKRAGLAGERSGLFMEQVRIVKEMRERDREQGRPAEFVRPRYMVWENVPGALSSNGGADFQAVLTEIVRIAEPDADDVPMPEKKWPTAGCLYDEMGRWSVAWRIHDAQFWGVPQRRKRIALVADFAGLSAPEVLFERKGLSGDFEQGRAQRKEATGAVGDSAGCTGYGESGIGYWQNGIQTLRAEDENRPSRPSNVIVSVHAKQDPIEGTAAGTERSAGEASAIGCDIYNLAVTGDIAATMTSGMGKSADHAGPSVMAVEPICIEMTSTKNTIVEDGISPTLTARMGTGGNQVNAIVMNDKGEGVMDMAKDEAGAIRLQEQGNQPIVLESNQNHATVTDSGICPTLSASMGLGGGCTPMIVKQETG